MTASSENQQPRLFRRLFKVVFILLLLSLATLGGICYSHWFAGQAVAWLIMRINEQGRANLAIEKFSGNLVDGVKVESIHIKQRNPSLQIYARNINLNLDWSRLKTGVVAISGNIAEADVAGMLNSGFNSGIVPDYHGLACFAALPTNLQISSFSVGLVKVQPWPDLPAVISVQNWQISPVTGENEQKTSMAFVADWRDKKIGAGNFAGLVKFAKKRVEGRLDLCFAGQKGSSEVIVTEKKGRLEASGFIASAAVDLANLSHWLVPIWQDEFPFGFDGLVDCSGSWLFNSELGFMGNLSGKIRKLRMVALGLFISVCEINGDWKLFDGNLDFVDAGSSFFGFPASMTGRIDAVFTSAQKWNLDFNCNQIDFARLANDLPWGVKYGMSLPHLGGAATFSVQLRNSRPEIVATLFTSDLSAGKHNELREIKGSIDYVRGAKDHGKLKIAMNCHAPHGILPIFQRFKGRRGGLLANLPASSGPITYSYVLTGIGSAPLSLDGTLMAEDQCVASTRGRWRDGMGDVVLSLVNAGGSGANVFTAGHIPLLDFILAK